MELGIFLLCLCVGVGVLLVSFVFAHRIFHETLIKRKVFLRSLEESKQIEQKSDDLAERLELFRQQRFSRPMGHAQATRKAHIQPTDKNA